MPIKSLTKYLVIIGILLAIGILWVGFLRQDEKISVASQLESKSHHRPNAPNPSNKAQTKPRNSLRRLSEESDQAYTMRLEEEFIRLKTSELSLQERIHACNDVITAMAKVRDLTEMVRFINDQAAGSSGIRPFVLEQLFASTYASVDQMIGEANRLAGDDAMNAQIGLYKNISGSDHFKADLSRFITESTNLDTSVLRVPFTIDLSSRNTNEAKSRLSELLEFGGSLPNDKQSNFLAMVCKSASSKLPQDVFEYIVKSRQSGNDNQPLEEIAQSAARKMLNDNPTKALAALGAQKESAPEFQQGMRYWLNSDPEAFSAWFNKSKSSLSASQLDIYHAASAESSWDKLSRTEMQSNLNQIQDPQIRLETEAKIRAAEEKQVMQQAEKNPSAILNSITEGTSPHTSESLATVISTWSQKSPDEAFQWYSTNKNKLSSDKIEYIAAGFAATAIKFGDDQVASGWISQIQDSALKERLMKELENRRK